MRVAFAALLIAGASSLLVRVDRAGGGFQGLDLGDGMGGKVERRVRTGAGRDGALLG